MQTSDTTPEPYPAPRKWFSPRFAGILLCLLALICVSVVITDRYAARDRASTKPTTGEASK